LIEVDCSCAMFERMSIECPAMPAMVVVTKQPVSTSTFETV